jgi:cardiolipin synthase
MEAAVKRNVKLKVVLAGPSDVMLAKHAERFLYTWLLQNNVEVYEHRNIVHAKVAVADMQVVTIGSFNFNDISTYASIELNLDIQDKAFVSGVHKELDRIIEQECVQITREDYAQTNSFWKRLRQRIAYNLVKWMLTLVTFYYRQR